MLNRGRYILDADGNPQLENDLIKWATWYETANRRVELTDLGDGVEVSTVFLSLDTSFEFLMDRPSRRPPMLWETMIFGGPMDRQIWRYRSLADAKAGHTEVVAMCQLAQQVDRIET